MNTFSNVNRRALADYFDPTQQQFTFSSKILRLVPSRQIDALAERAGR